MKNRKRLLIAGLILSVLIILIFFFRISGIPLSFTSGNSNDQACTVDRGIATILIHCNITGRLIINCVF